MTPLQALQELEKACESLAVPLNVHIHLKECAKTVGQALMAADEKKTASKD